MLLVSWSAQAPIICVRLVPVGMSRAFPAGAALPGELSLNTSETFEVMVQGGDIIVTLSKCGFRAVYYKPAGQPQLILRERTKTDDNDVMAQAWQAANAKARKLGWIV
jgi:hypothetical protein